MRIRLVQALVAFVAVLLSGCYVVPVRAPDGTVLYDYYTMPPVGSPMPAAPMGDLPPGPRVAWRPASGPGLSPANEWAPQKGVTPGRGRT